MERLLKYAVGAHDRREEVRAGRATPHRAGAAAARPLPPPCRRRRLPSRPSCRVLTIFYLCRPQKCQRSCGNGTAPCFRLWPSAFCTAATSSGSRSGRAVPPLGRWGSDQVGIRWEGLLPEGRLRAFGCAVALAASFGRAVAVPVHITTSPAPDLGVESGSTGAISPLLQPSGTPSPPFSTSAAALQQPQPANRPSYFTPCRSALVLDDQPAALFPRVGRRAAGRAVLWRPGRALLLGKSARMLRVRTKMCSSQFAKEAGLVTLYFSVRNASVTT